MALVIREAKREDCQSLLDLSKEINNFHCIKSKGPYVDVKVLEHDAFNVENSNIGFHVAEIDGNVIGYGHYSYTYALERGKCMFLHDLYVQEKYRNLKVGDKLMKAIAQKAVDQGVGQIDFMVADWNPAKNFYKRKGANNLTEEAEFHVYYFNREAIESITST